jgi:iron complex transport system substrate-binding protein
MNRALACAIFALALLVSCSRDRAAKTGPASRVVSLSPSTTETMFAIGAGAAMVGRSKFCDYPPEATKLPAVGGYVDASLESILALRPDLVIGARGPSGPGLTEKLAARGIATFFPETESFAQIDEMILGVGARTAHDADAKRVVGDMDARVAAIERAVTGLARPRVLLVYGVEPIVAAGTKTFADEMIRRAGGENAADGTGYPTLGMERIIVLDPDVVLNAAMGETRGQERISKDAPGWSSLRAVKAGRVVALADEVVMRPGPRIADGLRAVAHAIHPDAALP